MKQVRTKLPAFPNLYKKSRLVLFFHIVHLKPTELLLPTTRNVMACHMAHDHVGSHWAIILPTNES